jgi:hypothetical protein
MSSVRDPDTVEDGAAILGVDHAPRIGTASCDWLRDSRRHADVVIGGGVDAVNKVGDGSTRV